MSMFNEAKKLTKEVWWFLILTGLVAVVFGFVILLMPALTATTLVFLVALFTVIGGLVGLVNALSNIGKDRLWWLSLLVSVVSLGIGIFLLRNPLITAPLLVLVVAIVIFAQSLYDLVIASYATKEEGRWMWIVTGLLGVIAAIALIVYPEPASLAFVWVIGLYALVHGVVNIGYAFQIRKELKILTGKTK